ncbi:hypothetical protein [Streptomyces mirabilis]|uniref:hypothetical protein n=1 Tax=Streptomyces mirabilis TaxID=68239 RepID=UPI00399D5BEF
MAERDRWRGSGEAARRAVVDELLAARPVDREAAALRLRYDLSSTQVAAVLWGGDTATSVPAAERLHHAALTVARALEAARTLVIPAHDNNGWVWFAVSGETAEGQIRHLRSSLPEPAGVRAALGPPAPGPHGMRRSHLGALRAQRMALHASGSWLCDYRQLFRSRAEFMCGTGQKTVRGEVHSDDVTPTGQGSARPLADGVTPTAFRCPRGLAQPVLGSTEVGQRPPGHLVGVVRRDAQHAQDHLCQV